MAEDARRDVDVGMVRMLLGRPDLLASHAAAILTCCDERTVWSDDPAERSSWLGKPLAMKQLQLALDDGALVLTGAPDVAQEEVEVACLGRRDAHRCAIMLVAQPACTRSHLLALPALLLLTHLHHDDQSGYSEGADHAEQADPGKS